MGRTRNAKAVETVPANTGTGNVENNEESTENVTETEARNVETDTMNNEESTETVKLEAWERNDAFAYSTLGEAIRDQIGFYRRYVGDVIEHMSETTVAILRDTHLAVVTELIGDATPVDLVGIDMSGLPIPSTH